MPVTVEWSPCPHMPSASPVLALLPTAEGMWAGGIGAITLRDPGGTWTMPQSGPELRTVLALAMAGSTMLAAGSGGVARSRDGGKTWHHLQGLASLTVISLACSPTDDGQTMLIGTVGNGVFRSTDGGLTWTAANFGLHATEISDLVWQQDGSVIACSPAGLYRSTNEGRSWRLLSDHVFAFVRQYDQMMAAIGIDGSVWRSPDSGDRWDQVGSLPTGTEPQAFVSLADGSLMIGTVEHGVFRSPDGATWIPCGDHQVLTFAVHGDGLFAGTTSGVLEYAETPQSSWHSLGSPALSDYYRIHTVDDAIFVSGTLSLPQRWDAAQGWVTLEACPAPTTFFAPVWDGELFACTPEGLFASIDCGESWLQRSDEPGGEWLTVRADGVGWMATIDGSRFAITRDRGHTWSQLQPPFGVFPIVALAAPYEVKGSPLLAVTYDAAASTAILWQSTDDGETWQRGNDAATSSAVIATLGNPLALSLGDAIMLRGGDGLWIRTQPGGGTVRRLAASPTAGLIALTQDSLWWKRPNEPDWQEIPMPAANGDMTDIYLDQGTLLALVAGTELWSCRLDATTAEPTL